MPSLCPRCKIDDFNWSMIDDEDYDYENGDGFITSWTCGNCRYNLVENETLERKCTECSYEPKSQMRCKDEQGFFWWCRNCHSVIRDK